MAEQMPKQAMAVQNTRTAPKRAASQPVRGTVTGRDAKIAGNAGNGDVGDGHVQYGDEVGTGQQDGDEPQHVAL